MHVFCPAISVFVDTFEFHLYFSNCNSQCVHLQSEVQVNCKLTYLQSEAGPEVKDVLRLARSSGRTSLESVGRPSNTGNKFGDTARAFSRSRTAGLLSADTYTKVFTMGSALPCYLYKIAKHKIITGSCIHVLTWLMLCVQIVSHLLAKS